MKRIETSLPGVVLIEPSVFEDERGYFFESYHQSKFAAIGITERFVQDNQSGSVKNTLRGLHYQIRRAQAKLCRVIRGSVLDVVVDIRRGSPTFGRHERALLSSENRLQIYVPPGFAHGYAVLSETAEFLYKCSDFYYPEYERGVAWNDPVINIDWGLTDPILSPKDQKNRLLSEISDADLPPYVGDSPLGNRSL